MPAERTAAQLVQKTREWIQNFNQTPWRDGFAADAANGGTPILSLLNEAQRRLLPTGYAKCQFFLRLIAGQREYTLDPWITETLAVWHNDTPLLKTTLPGINTGERNWRGASAGTVQRYYTYSDVMGFYPTPNTTDLEDAKSVLIIADSVVPDLVEPDQIPARLPARFHDTLALGAALAISNQDFENEAAGRRIGYLSARFKEDMEDLTRVVQQRDINEEAQITPLEYREYYRQGTGGY